MTPRLHVLMFHRSLNDCSPHIRLLRYSSANHGFHRFQLVCSSAGWIIRPSESAEHVPPDSSTAATCVSAPCGLTLKSY